MVKPGELVGASKSLNKTITEILEHLGEDGADRPGPYEDKRAYLYDKISDLMIKRYRQGIRRGHAESHKVYIETGEFPSSLRLKGTRKVLNGKKRPFSCSSQVK